MNIFCKIFFSWFLLLGSVATAEQIVIAYPEAGTIVSAQVGLIFEKTEILKNHGIEASVVSLGTGRELKTALVSGQADVILTSQSNFLILLGEGYPAKAINSLGSAGRLALVVAADSPYKSVSDLKGKKVATIFGTSLHQPALKWSAEIGGAEVVNINQVGALHAALKAKAVAAILTYDPILTQLEAAKAVRILREDRFDLITVASEKVASRARVTALNKAFSSAVLYLRSHRDEVDGWFSERARIGREAIQKSSRQNHNYAAKEGAPVELAISKDFENRLMAEGAFLFAEKIIKKPAQISTNILR